jgi:hypothetical protein
MRNRIEGTKVCSCTQLTLTRTEHGQRRFQLEIEDEFCKYFEAENAGNLLEDSSDIKRRRRSVSLSDSEIMTILLYFIQKIEDKKS